MRTKITYNGEVISFTDGDKITINCKDEKMLGDILIETEPPAVTEDSPFPIEVSTEEEMAAILENATESGGVYKYMGETTETYEKGALYVVEANLISFTIDGTTYQAVNGMTWEEWVADTTYNTNNFHISVPHIYAADGGAVCYPDPISSTTAVVYTEEIVSDIDYNVSDSID